MSTLPPGRPSLAQIQSAKVDARIKELVDNAPPLGPEQISRLRAILAPALRDLESDRIWHESESALFPNEGLPGK